MAIRTSTGLKNWLFGGGSVIEAFAFGVIDIYSGTQPDSADDVPTGTHLAQITDGGAPFTPGSEDNGLLFFQIPAPPLLTIDPSQNWILVPSTNGEAGWWRFKTNELDDDSQSQNIIRLDGAIIAPFNEMFLTETNLVVGETQPIELFQISWFD